MQKKGISKYNIPMSRERDDVVSIFKSALEAVKPEKAVKEGIKAHLKSYRNVNNLYLLAFGKAACTMAKSALTVLENRISKGYVITKYHHCRCFSFPDKIEVFEAAHPVPDEMGVRATEHALRGLSKATEKDLVLTLISGGGSALLCSPFQGLTLEDKMNTTELLLKAGADIFELNTVRKHISSVKGGRLAETLHPANVLSLIVSDVIGDRLDVIASGPTTPDPTTYQDALRVVKKYGIEKDLPPRVLNLLQRGARGELPETLKPDSNVFDRVENHIISSNRHCLELAKIKAEESGYQAEVLTDSLQGEARDAAEWLFSEVKKRFHLKRPLCIITGGETTVTVKGNGLGGRNTEFALSFAMKIDGLKGITLLSAGTDGTDGPTDAAGAVVDGETIKRAKSLGLEPVDYLNRNDSYNFFKKTGELLITGPTGTNVMDIQIVLIRP